MVSFYVKISTIFPRVGKSPFVAITFTLILRRFSILFFTVNIQPRIRPDTIGLVHFHLILLGFYIMYERGSKRQDNWQRRTFDSVAPWWISAVFAHVLVEHLLVCRSSLPSYGLLSCCKMVSPSICFHSALASIAVVEIFGGILWSRCRLRIVLALNDACTCWSDE